MAKSPTLIIGTLFVVLGTVLNFIAFVSPYWLISDPRANNPFQRIGLWEACLKDFVDPKDYVSKLYNGCWWIFWPEFNEIRYWLNPGELNKQYMPFLYTRMYVPCHICHNGRAPASTLLQAPAISK